MNRIIGQIIEEQVKAKKMTAIEFAKELSTERSNVYNIFKRDSIDTSLLKKIGQILEYDFFQHFLEKNTIDKIKLEDVAKKSKILLELELSEDEIMKIGFEEKILKILNK